MVSLVRRLFLVRELLVQFPSWAFYWAFSWVFPTTILREKAAACPYPLVRTLVLRRSGIRIGSQAETHYGLLVVGRAKSPPAVELGDRVAVGPRVTFVTSSYPDSSRLLSHPEVRSLIKRLQPIRVEEDAWIGAGAVILPGVTIGRCAIVGAGAVVTRDVPANTIVAGVPARVIRSINDTLKPNDAT